MCLRLRDCVQHVFWPVADKPKSIARSFVIVQYGSSINIKESEFAAPVLTWAQKRSDLRERSTVGKFVRSSLQGLNHEDVLLKLETKIINNCKGHARASAHGLRAIMETKTLSQKLNLAKECQLYKINKKRAKEFCRLLQNIAHLCLILKTFL